MRVGERHEGGSHKVRRIRLLRNALLMRLLHYFSRTWWFLRPRKGRTLRIGSKGRRS